MYFGTERKKQLLECLAADIEWLKQHNVMDYSLLVGLCSVHEIPSSISTFSSSSSTFILDSQQDPPPLEGLFKRNTSSDEASRHKFYSLWMPSYPENEGSSTPQGDGGDQQGCGDNGGSGSIGNEGSSNRDHIMKKRRSLFDDDEGEESNDIRNGITPPSQLFSSSPISGSFWPAADSIINQRRRTREVYLLGLVDILQVYGIKKRMESLVKTGYYYSSGTDPKGLSVVSPEQYGNRLLDFINNHTV